jgi:ankyrin repeat protein
MALPPRPNLEYLKKLAKDRLEELQRRDPAAQLADAQLAVAREHGFASWRKLRAHLDSLQPAATSDSPPPTPEQAQELFDAINRRDEPAVRRLLAADPALVNVRHADGTTPLLVAAERDHAGIIELLLGHGGDGHAVYAHSAHTPLSWAVTTESFESARALVRGGVQPDLYCAAGLGDVEAVRAFFDAGGHLRPNASRTGSSR